MGGEKRKRGEKGGKKEGQLRDFLRKRDKWEGWGEKVKSGETRSGY